MEEPFFACNVEEPSVCTSTIDCGNNVLDPGEKCEPPSVNGCAADCRSFVPEAPDPPVCGNSRIEAGETCDPSDAGNGCDVDCHVEPGFTCPRPGVCFATPECGDGVRGYGEACDDDNAIDGDGCTDCAVDDEWVCTSASPSVCEHRYCGDGNRSPGEECDDGAECSVSGDECVDASDCTVGETCEPRSGDGCSADCTVEGGWRCSSSGCQPICGDGIVIAGKEECDDHDTTRNDGCSPACKEEPFWNCTNLPGQPSTCASTIECGNDAVEPGEVCDPPLVNGCSSDCESFDPDSGVEPADCTNGIIELGEECAPGGIPGCDATCHVVPGYVCPAPGVCTLLPVCGNGVQEVGEECDDGSVGGADGCVGCAVTSGWVCVGTHPTVCELPDCGDGVRQFGEECDDGRQCSVTGADCDVDGDCGGGRTCDARAGDGCSASCAVEEYWVCPEQGEPCWEVCGDGAVVGDEECDDGKQCSVSGADCDDDSDCPTGQTCGPQADDGCSAACRVEPGWDCTLTVPGCVGPTCARTCTQAVCGNGNVESGEGCDDGDIAAHGFQIAGDGCGPTCQKEPTVTHNMPPVVNVVCGDGMVTGAEECDDGNAQSGDGCSGTEDANPVNHCQKESGFDCTSNIDYPDSVHFQVTYRDFKQYSENNGHPDFQIASSYPWVGSMPGPVCTTSTPNACTAGPGVTCEANSCGVLDTDGGKPIFHMTSGGGVSRGWVTDANTYALWYRDAGTSENTIADNLAGTAGQHGVIQMCHVLDSLALTQSAPGQDKYEFDSSRYFPLGDTGVTPNIPTRCFGLSPSQNRNYHFTTELRYFFQYKGDEALTFRGDDDVWVFVNGRLAVDIGGVHGALYGRVVLGDDDSTWSLHGASSATPLPAEPLTAAELADLADPRFGLTPRGVYEIVLFHAERRTTESNFHLTLQGFLAPRSVCEPVCGDGIVAGWEVCDDGTYNAGDPNHDQPGEYNSNTIYGACNTSCTMRTFCGDGIRQGVGSVPVAGTEACDNGRNIDTYSTGAPDECAPGCVQPPRCGDGIVQSPAEQCDNGDGVNSDTAYGPGACTSSCHYAYCGDEVVQGPAESCDLGTDNGGYGPGTCWYDCTEGPRCGDGERNGPEECDYNDPEAENCDTDCTFLPYCGDGVVNGTAGRPEACDYGQFGSDSYDGCTEACVWGPRCGDDILQSEYEQCDNGDGVNSDTAYGPTACTTFCLDGPRCGDGVLQASKGEACDNGFNEDTYAFDAGSCGPGCAVPTAHCGDGVLELAYEECDNGDDNVTDPYGTDQCSMDCAYGGYCGDGVVNGTESCDRGAQNGQEYGDDSCGYDCQPGPRCGDGIRNGAEECDGSLHCSAGCLIEGYCGDGVPNGDEECDYGQFASDDYGSCTELCERGPYCGDEHVDEPYEECDLGTVANTGDYAGCTDHCMFGPRCGDGLVQEDEGEACDNGFNDDPYRTGAEDECGEGCQPPAASCGDGTLDPAYEECDNGDENSIEAYGFTACTTACTFGGYCGDGMVNGTETCDRGPLNGTEYGTDSCGYDCKPGPRCGDGIRNGTEQCDGTAHCTSQCKLEPYCGDGVVGAGEACDYGKLASNAYGGCTTACEWGPRCGDGTADKPYEECDLGTAKNVGAYDGCTAKCTLGPRCGDGSVQADEGESCDNGFNDDVYQTGAADECGPNCTLPSLRCGDGVLQPAYEECDNGSKNSSSAYGPTACTTQCKLGPYCGDGAVNGKESCDRGALNGEEYGANSCGLDCKEGPRCGDGIRNGPEECDGTEHCTSKCTLEVYCGDGVRNGDEQCDYGQFASTAYGGCTDDCQWGPRCGDGVPDAPYEECDLGTADNDGSYEGCTAACTLGPRCGDGALQKAEGEACDNGFNEDTYASDSDACGPGCKLPPRCGDGKVQAAFELCDEGADNSDTAYNGCATTCLWGPYCGDGQVDPEESCDEGANNAPYSASGAGCGYDCEPAPYCGDGIRNGPEECDDGTQKNVGGYGKCNADCTRGPYCGDKHVDSAEQCDEGPIGSLSCTTECTKRAIL
jgi:fibro-slime domain-containing protein